MRRHEIKLTAPIRCSLFRSVAVALVCRELVLKMHRLNRTCRDLWPSCDRRGPPPVPVGFSRSEALLPCDRRSLSNQPQPLLLDDLMCSIFAVLHHRGLRVSPGPCESHSIFASLVSWSKYDHTAGLVFLRALLCWGAGAWFIAALYMVCGRRVVDVNEGPLWPPTHTFCPPHGC